MPRRSEWSTPKTHETRSIHSSCRIDRHWVRRGGSLNGMRWWGRLRDWVVRFGRSCPICAEMGCVDVEHAREWRDRLTW